MYMTWIYLLGNGWKWMVKNVYYIQKLAKVGWKEGLGKEGFVTSGKRKVV